MAVVFITGGARGLGLALAQQYAAAGNEVIIGVRDPKAAVEVPPGCEVLPLDVTDADSVAALAEALNGRPVDMLINNAGVHGAKPQSAMEMNFAGFEEALAVNTIGPLRVTQALLPNLLQQQGAKIAIVTSRVGALAVRGTGLIAYRASKAAANKVSQCLAAELEEKGIAVAAIHPGWVSTDMGGPTGPVSPDESAAGIRAVMDRLSLGETGRFWSYDGSEMPW